MSQTVCMVTQPGHPPRQSAWPLNQVTQPAKQSAWSLNQATQPESLHGNSTWSLIRSPHQPIHIERRDTHPVNLH